MTIPALGSLAWHESWAGFGEGPFTLLAKVRALNSVGKNYFREQLGGSNEISFVTGPSSNRTALARRIMAASVQTQFGSFFTEVANEERLKFCESCLGVGYHAAACQLDIFDRCPIHMELLSNCCTRCKHPSPRFALATPGPLPRFACIGCKSPLAGAAPLDSSAESWAAPKSLDRIHQFHAWAASATSHVNLLSGHEWITCAPGTRNVRGQALCGVLLKLKPWQYDRIHFAPCYVDVLRPIRLIDEGLSEPSLSYELIAKFALPPAARDYVAWHGWATASGGLRVPVEPHVSVQEHAAYIWRCQFEELGALNARVCLDSADDKPFKEFLTRWTSSFRAPTAVGLMDRIDRNGWLKISSAIELAAVRIAQKWAYHREVSLRNHRKPTISEAWLARLGRWELHTASPVGLAHTTNAAGCDELHPFVC